MPARTPEECDRLFADGINRGDVEAVVVLYEPGASLIAGSGEVATGMDAIREAVKGFVTMKPKLVMGIFKVVRAGDDLAVLYNDWTMTATRPDGGKLDTSGKAIEIVRRQPDGTWRFAVDDPFARG